MNRPLFSFPLVSKRELGFCLPSTCIRTFSGRTGVIPIGALHLSARPVFPLSHASWAGREGSYPARVSQTTVTLHSSNLTCAALSGRSASLRVVHSRFNFPIIFLQGRTLSLFVSEFPRLRNTGGLKQDSLCAASIEVGFRRGFFFPFSVHSFLNQKDFSENTAPLAFRFLLTQDVSHFFFLPRFDARHRGPSRIFLAFRL